MKNTREQFERWYNEHTGDGDSYFAMLSAWNAALSQQEKQEPVAWVSPLRYGSQVTFNKPVEPSEKCEDIEWYCYPLFKVSPSVQALEDKCKELESRIEVQNRIILTYEEKTPRLEVQIAELTAKLDKAREDFTEIRNSLQFANDSVGSAITDTIWMLNKPQTLFDSFDEALEELNK